MSSTHDAPYTFPLLAGSSCPGQSCKTDDEGTVSLNSYYLSHYYIWNRALSPPTFALIWVSERGVKSIVWKHYTFRGMFDTNVRPV